MTLRAFSNISGGAVLVGALALVLAGCGGAVDESNSSDTTGATSQELKRCPPAVPDPSLAVPAGNKVAFELDAVGVQIYTCQASGAAYSWTLKAPDATLYARGRVVGKHYAGPTWEYKDGSKVVGSRLAGFTPDPSAIPWLLLQAASHEGDGRMSNISYIQRLETTGGLAPSSGCDADHVGAEARVDYTAAYVFFQPGHSCGCK